jgi:hypothetical protein
MGRKDFGIIYDLILKNKAWMMNCGYL